MGITGIFLLQLCVDYCQAWTEGLTLSNVYFTRDTGFHSNMYGVRKRLMSSNLDVLFF